MHKESGFAIIDVHGVGYKVFSSAETLSRVATKKNVSVTLWTHLAVRDDALDLYGFCEKEELEFFELLLSVSGIGPKSAITILNVASVRSIKSAIASGDATHLTKTTGIGTKKAEKIILELRDKLDVLDSDIGEQKEITDASEALQALGYSRREAQDALRKVPRLITSTEAKIKEALKLLGR